MNQRAMWLSLFWKEWRERRWEMASLTAILAAVPLAVAFEDPRSLVFGIQGTLVPYVVIASFFLGSSVAAGEETRGTAGFLQALPAAGWQPALVKLLMAVITASVPILAVALGAFLFATCCEWMYPGGAPDLFDPSGAWPFSDWLTSITLAPILGALSLIVWAAAWGVGRKGEIEAGAWAVAAVSGAAMVLALLKGGADSLPILAIVSMTPAGVVFGLANEIGGYDYSIVGENAARLATVVCFAIGSHALLLRRFLQRFGSIVPEKRWIESPARHPAAKPWLGSPRKSPLSSILWKQFRETLPVCLIGVSAMLCLAVVVAMVGFNSNRSFVSSLTDFVITFSPPFGLLLAAVAGIGVFLDDLSPGLHTFWRSRPIQVDQWYWTKFFAGLTVPVLTCACLLGGMLLLFQVSYGDGHASLSVWGTNSPVYWAMTIQVLTYCGAVAAVCLVRRPLYAAIFASSAWVLVYLLVATWEVIPYTASGVGWLTAILSVGCAVAGWQALRHDIGWQR